MTNKKTEITFILDRSGSMSGLESDTIGGYNSLLEKQKDLEGECKITTVLFDDKIEVIHDRIDIKNIKNLTENEYYVRGMTALIDAIGYSINKQINVHKAGEKSENVMFVIITDGYENSSKEFTSQKVKEMIEYQKEKYNWEFVFLGANIDSVETAKYYGIGADRAMDYKADSEGVSLNYEVMSDNLKNYRTEGKLQDKEFDRIRKNYKERK